MRGAPAARENPLVQTVTLLVYSPGYRAFTVNNLAGPPAGRKCSLFRNSGGFTSVPVQAAPVYLLGQRRALVVKSKYHFALYAASAGARFNGQSLSFTAGLPVFYSSRFTGDVIHSERPPCLLPYRLGADGLDT